MRRLTAQRWIGRSLLIAALTVALGCPADNGTQPGTLTLSVNPTTATVLQGGSTPVAATATSGGGFSGAVTFAVTGAPTGVTAAVSNVNVSGSTTTATVTLQVAASTAPGTYNLTIRAQGTGVADGTAAFSLTVTALPDYALSLAPAALTINQGTNGTSTVTITRTNFTDAVTLTLGGAPAGVTGAFAPAAPTGTTSTLTVTVGAAVAPGTYNLTVNGAATPGNRSTPLTLTVAPAPDYALSLSPTTLTLVEGTNGTSTVTITRTNFTGAVTLAVGNAPPGVTGSFAPAAPTGTTSTLTLTVAFGVAPGVYNLTVDGTGAPGSRSAALQLTVTALPPNFSLTVAPPSLTIVQGGNDNTTVTINRTNFTGAVTLGINAAPGGVTGSFAPGSTTGTTSTLTVNVGAAVPPGTYSVEVAGNGTPGTRTTILSLTVVSGPDYTLALTPTSLSINQNSTGDVAVTITRTNFTGPVTLSLGNAPAGVTGAFVPAAPTGTTSTLTITVGAAVTPGTYNLTVDGTATPRNRSEPLTLTVLPAPNYTLDASPDTLTVQQGNSDNTIVSIARINFGGTITLSLGNAPAGVTSAFVPPAPTGAASTSTLTVTVGAAVTPGTYDLTVDGAATPGARSTPLVLIVTATPNYTLAVNPTSLSIQQNASDGANVTISRTNFTGAVTLGLGGAPAGVTGAFVPAAPTGTTSTLTVTVGAGVAPGTYNLTVDGTATAGNRSTPLTLTVTATPNYTLSVNPTSLSIAQNANANTAVTITRTNFTGAVTLSLGGAPAGVTGSFAPAAPTGTTSTLTVSVGPAVSPGLYNVTVDGTGTPGSRSTALQLTVTGGGGGNNVTVSFANCAVADRAVWLAYQDGNGAWTRVTGAGDVYTFGITSGTGGFAYVVLGAGNESSVQVQYMTQAELTAGTLDFCGGAVPTTRTITGTATNFGATGMAFVSLGGGVGTANFGQPNFTITGVSDGTHDLVGFASDFLNPGNERGLLRRDIVVSGDGTVSPVDFTGSESFAAASATMTIMGLSGGETIIQSLAYHVGATCEAATLGFPGTAAPSFTAFGIPAAPQRASDFHRIGIIASNGSTDVRTVNESFHTFGARTVSLGSSLAAPTVTTLAGPYKRLQAAFTQGGEYGGPSTFGYVDASTDKTVNLSASAAYRGGPGITLALADFSALAGWNNSWAPASAATGNWNVSAIGGTAGSACVENANQKSAARGGTF